MDAIFFFLDNRVFKTSNKYELVSISKISGLIIENKIFSSFNIDLFRKENISSFVVSWLQNKIV